MPKMFLSNSELKNILLKATYDERLTLTKILNDSVNSFEKHIRKSNDNQIELIAEILNKHKKLYEATYNIKLLKERILKSTYDEVLQIVKVLNFSKDNLNEITEILNFKNKIYYFDDLIEKISESTEDEIESIKDILSYIEEEAYESTKLQEEISLAGGNSLANIWRGQGTGYIDILDDVANNLSISGLEPYEAKVSYFDEIEKLNDENPKCSIEEAKNLGIKYIKENEEKIIVELIKKSYDSMEKDKKKFSENLIQVEKEKNDTELIIKNNVPKELKLTIEIKEVKELILLIDTTNEDELEYKKELEKQLKKLKGDKETISKKIRKNIILKVEKDLEIKKIEIKIKKVTNRIESFNKSINEVAKKFNTSHVGKLAGTAGIMYLAGLGGFATYTFLTSMMSTLSFGMLGFGAYTAATSLLSIIIGPIGWSILILTTILTLCGPNKAKMMILVATVGAIRQREEYQVSRVEDKTS